MVYRENRGCAIRDCPLPATAHVSLEIMEGGYTGKSFCAMHARGLRRIRWEYDPDGPRDAPLYPMMRLDAPRFGRGK